MYRLIRVDKRIPNGTIWQARRAYLLPPVDDWSRVFGPTGTRWSNPLGGWTTQHGGVSLFHPAQPFTIACYGEPGQERFYVDIAHRVRIDPEVIEFVDLFLDVMIDPSGNVTEKDEQQLMVLPEAMRAFTRRARDEVRSLIGGRHELFDRASRYYALPEDALDLPPAVDPLVL